MPPAAKRNASVILFDVNTKPEFFQASKNWLLNIFASKHFSESKDNTKLILLNTEETDNVINSKFGKCPHVSEVGEISNYDPKFIATVIDEDVKTAKANWLVGLAAAIEAISQNFYGVNGIMNLQLVFLTDFSTPVEAKEKQIEFVINNLNKMGIHLYIFGPKVKVPDFMSTRDDIERWSKNIVFISDESENPNLSIAKRIVENTKGVICDLQLGQHLFECYTEQWGLQAWKVPLTIGTSLSIPALTTRFLKKEGGPQFKADTIEGVEDVWKWHPVDDALAEVPYTNVIGGVFKYGKFVPLPSDIEKDFKYEGPRGFKIIGFTDRTNISELYMVGDGPAYVESENSRTFKILLDVLAKQNKCAIAQKIYMKNCKPKLVALLPKPEQGIFILVELPYAENVDFVYVEQDIDEAPKLEKGDPVADAMYEYLEKLDVTDPNNRDSEGNVKVPLVASLMNATQLGVIYQQCLNKYLDEESVIEEINIELPKLIKETDYMQHIPVRPKEEPKIKSDD